MIWRSRLSREEASSPPRGPEHLWRGANRVGYWTFGSFGLSFTWYSHAQRRAPIHRRLDQALANVAWKVGFPDGSAEVLPRLHSDHSPLLLRCCPPPATIVNKPFRFEAARMDHPQYPAVVSGAWDKGASSYVAALAFVRDDSLTFFFLVNDSLTFN